MQIGIGDRIKGRIKLLLQWEHWQLALRTWLLRSKGKMAPTAIVIHTSLQHEF
jgi:hypothetical protein